MSALNPTHPDLMCDAHGRPYFLWDVDLTLAAFRQLLADADGETQMYMIAKLMRQAKPDDVFTFVTLARVRQHWPAIAPQLGNKREFWQWILDAWEPSRHAA
jgi:hypothetical protein